MLNDFDVRAPISPLHLAAYHGHHHAMEVLVQSLLDLDVRYLSALKSHVECVDVLINQGASILVKDFTLKRTPIHAAATNGHSECLRLLIGNADLQSAVDVQDGNRQTPLMLSVLSGHTDCVYSLLNKGARDKWHRTALHRRVVRRRPDTSWCCGGSYTPPSQCGPSPSSQTTRATRQYTGPATTVRTGQRDSEVSPRPQTNTHINIACLKSPQPASGGHEPRQSAQEP
ncbi:serine/threonine-protein phosphatase 6 regulatory ankyrin repeat subunit A-like [Salvelinus namaycush]|uniref:Serine/threonine-protein phosphatase 6 regulatory ankyrin repeat subunit A-like n=1 Tax=Salvelinus namaycush TaxID=8040 RepID=A0A8U0QYT7_SALNM|nr:serine/threonine-protein phosphatase 6 regulatory ankyrin repeat subunit A-like [Salvelinus namaycush]